MTARYRWELLHGLFSRRGRKKRSSAGAPEYDLQLFVRDLEDRRVLSAGGIAAAMLPVEAVVANVAEVSATTITQTSTNSQSSTQVATATDPIEVAASASNTTELQSTLAQGGSSDSLAVLEQRADVQAELLGETISLSAGSAGARHVVLLRADTALVEAQANLNLSTSTSASSDPPEVPTQDSTPPVDSGLGVQLDVELVGGGDALLDVEASVSLAPDNSQEPGSTQSEAGLIVVVGGDDGVQLGLEAALDPPTENGTAPEGTEVDTGLIVELGDDGLNVDLNTGLNSTSENGAPGGPQVSVDVGGSGLGASAGIGAGAGTDPGGNPNPSDNIGSSGAGIDGSGGSSSGSGDAGGDSLISPASGSVAGDAVVGLGVLDGASAAPPAVLPTGEAVESDSLTIADGDVPLPVTPAEPAPAAEVDPASLLTLNAVAAGFDQMSELTANLAAGDLSAAQRLLERLLGELGRLDRNSADSLARLQLVLWLSAAVMAAAVGCEIARRQLKRTPSEQDAGVLGRPELENPLWV